MNRALRRRLDRQADRIVDAIGLQRMPDGIDLASHYGILRRGRPIEIVCATALDVFGATTGDPHLRSIIDRDRRPGMLPVVVIVDDGARSWTCVARLPLVVMAAGGSA